jgi:hypothetical protein
VPLPKALQRVTHELPYALRQDIEGYVRTLDAAQPEIYADAETTTEQVSPEEFLFFAGVWRLWAQVDGQRWIVKNSLDIALGYGATGISAGAFSYSRGSDDVAEVRDLHSRYRRWLENRKFSFVIDVNSPRALLIALRERGDGD